MTEIFTAKTVDEAKAMAAKKFGKNLNEINFEILEREKAGLFGIGKKDAKVKATYEDSTVKAAAPAELVKTPAPETEKESVITEEAVPEAQEEKTDKAAPASETGNNETTVQESEKAAEPVQEAVSETVKTEAAPAAEKKHEVKTETKEEKKPVPKKESAPIKENNVPAIEDDDAEYSLENFALIENESLLNPKVKIARDYITSIFRAMDVDAEFIIYQNETGAVINIESDNNGTIIGRRGETLDSIQYLCSIIANKGDKDYFRITIDCLGYRSKRKETLEQLAAKVAKSVLKTGRSQPLEPMNPYERRVIHSAISAIDGVSSRSVGEEPYRKIIISSNNPKKSHRKKRSGEGRNDKPRRNNRRRSNSESFERRSIDLSTSFEKDYKKPKPEDSMEGGLYGKIEL